MSKQGSQRYLHFIKKQVSSDWKDLAECLEFEAPDIENIEGKHRDDRSRCMELLQQWYKRKGNAATIHVLMEGLQEAELQHVVDSLKNKYPELNEKPLSPTSRSKQTSEGLDRATSVDNLLALPPPSRHVDHSSLRGLDPADIDRQDPLCTDGTDDITMLYRQVQSVLRTAREKSKQEVKVQLETMQAQVQAGRLGVDAMIKEVKMLKEKNEKAEKILLEQKAEINEEIQQLQETNKSLEATIEELLTAKPPVEGGNQQEDPVQTMSGQVRSKDKSKARNTGQVERSVVQGFSPISKQPWVKKVSFGGLGRNRGKFVDLFGVAVSKDNEVYIADHGNTRIQVFTMDGVYIREFTTTLPGDTGEKLEPHDVALDRNDNLWVVSNEHVVQYSREGTCLAKIDTPPGKYHRSLTVAMATEQVIVTVYDRLLVFDQDGSEVGTYGSDHRSPKPWRPQRVTVDGKGNILVTDVKNHCVHLLDREGNFKFKLGSEGSHETQLRNPGGICVDGMGNIIVVDSGNGCVKMFDSQGRFLWYVACMNEPWAVAVSPGGDVVVTDLKNIVSVWTQG